MSVKVTLTYACGGCDAVEVVEIDRLSSRFHGFNGQEHGFGHWQNETVDAEAHCPEGWMAFDPYTRCTYCPECIEKIWPDPEERHGIKLVVVRKGEEDVGERNAAPA